VAPGELRSIIGPNGAGKSTFFKLISGELAPTARADREVVSDHHGA
jgi:ABC-type hemin transport system ATPase subunit